VLLHLSPDGKDPLGQTQDPSSSLRVPGLESADAAAEEQPAACGEAAGKLAAGVAADGAASARAAAGCEGDGLFTGISRQDTNWSLSPELDFEEFLERQRAFNEVPSHFRSSNIHFFGSAAV
jgi:hypothetical protein